MTKESAVKEPIRVLRIIARLNIGGPAIHAGLLSAGLTEYGYTTMLVTGSLSEGEGDMSDYARSLGVEPVFVPSLGRSVSPLDDLRAFRTLLRIMFTYRPRIVHTHTAKAGTLGRLAAFCYNLSRRLTFRKRQRAVVIHTFHGHVFHGYFPWWINWGIRWIERILGLLTDVVITITPQQREEICRQFRVIPPRKARVVRLGFDLAPLAKLDRGGRRHDPSRLHVGIVGRLVPIKDHRTFLRAARVALSTETAPSMVFHVIGDGELRDELWNTARDLKIEKDVLFHGWIRDLTKVYSMLDAVMLTSLNEGTPVALIEAMAAGVPVVATAVGGVVDLAGEKTIDLGGGLVQHERALLAAKGDAVSLGAGILRLASEQNLAPVLAKEARDFILSRYSKERLYADIDSLYREELPRYERVCQENGPESAENT